MHGQRLVRCRKGGASRARSSAAGGKVDRVDLSQVIGGLDEQARGAALPTAAPCAARRDRGQATGERSRRCHPSATLPTDFGVSRITVRKALDAAGGGGAGPPPPRRRHVCRGARREELLDAVLVLPRTWHRAAVVQRAASWLRRAAGAVTPEEAMVLGLSPGSPVLRFAPHPLRRRYSRWRSNIRLDLGRIVWASRPRLVDRVALRGVGAVTGCRPVRALQRLRAVLFTAEQADLLGHRGGGAGAAD